MNDQRYRSESGHALLEASLATALLVSLSMGIVDIARLHDARTAIRAAVLTALRCLHPRDAACRSQSTGPREIAYDVYETSTRPVFYRESYEYRGMARATFAPVYTYPDLTATVLSRVSFDVPGSSSVAIERLFPASAEISYLARRESLPAIRGALSIDPRFVSPQDGLRTAPSLSIPIRSVSGATSSERLLGRVTFRLDAPAIGRSLPCYAAGADGRADLARRCEESWEWEDGQRFGGRRYAASPRGTEGSLHTFVALRISGEKRGGTAGARGSISARLLVPGLSIALGGRRLDSRPGDNEAGAAADFVPRGIPFSQVQTADADRYSELWDYQALSVPYGEEIAIELTLHAERGEIGWRGEVIDIFAPTYEIVTERVACESALRPSEISIGRCALPGGYPPPESVRQESSSPIETREHVLGCGVSSPSAIAISRGLDPSDITIATVPSSACPATRESRPCPQNYGVPEGVSGQNECPLPPELKSMATNVRWETAERRLRESFEWRPQTCGQSEPTTDELPSTLLRYPRLRLGERRTARFVPVSESDECESYEKRSESLPTLRSEAADTACDWRATIARHPSLTRYTGWTLDPSRSLVAETKTGRAPGGCSRFRRAFEDDGRRLLAAGVSATRALSICDGNPRCAYEPISARSERSEEADPSAAANLGLRELRTIYPAARGDCDGADCAALDVGVDGESAFASARLEVPLLVLLGKSVTLEHSSRRRMEGSVE